MSTATEITRLTNARNTIRDKLIDLGLATSTSKLDALADAVDSITNRGAVSATVQEGDTYTIPAGYHNGSGTVSGIAGGGNYSLQSKTITPTKNQQSVTPDSGFYGLSDVTVSPIPEAYQNVSSVTATAADVLASKVIVDSSGENITGTMPNNGAVSKTLDATVDNQSYTVPRGYHSGSGVVQITLETKNVTPTTSVQSITPTTGKVLGEVVVAKIPDEFADTSSDTATAGDILLGQKAHGFNEDTGKAVAITGTMPNNGAVSKTLDATTSNQSYTVPAGYHNGSGTVQIVLESKTITPTKTSQTINATTGKVISSVTVNPIPSDYQDVTGVDATAADVLDGKTIVLANGNEVVGTMTENGTVTRTLDATANNQSYTIAAGHHSGSGSVSIVLEQKDATPTTSSQTITPTNGKVLSQVTVNAIPVKFGDTTGDTAVAANLLAGVKAHTISNGVATQITGAMANNGAVNGTIDGLTATTFPIPAGYTTGGAVALTNDIELALAAI